MPFFQTKTAPGQVHYQVVDSILPSTTLFIHGNLASNNWWKPAQTVWTSRAQGSALKGAMVMAEYRGCGQSADPTEKKQMHVENLAQDFIELIDHLGQGPVNVVGHSAGGLIAAVMAAKAPEKIKSILLLDPVGAHGVQFDDSMYTAFEQMRTDRNLTSAVIGSTILGLKPDDRLFNEHIVDDAWRAVKSIGMWVLEGLKGLDLEQKLSQVRTKALVLHGEHDQLLPLKDSQDLARVMNAEFQLLKSCGHCANFEKPEQFVEVCHNFLAGSV
jgi:3-oxoadipate enol-lactonase